VLLVRAVQATGDKDHSKYLERLLNSIEIRVILEGRTYSLRNSPRFSIIININ